MVGQDGTSPLFEFTPLDLSSVLGETVIEEKRGEFAVSIQASEGIRVSQVNANTMKESGFKALLLAQKISPTCDKEISIRCARKVPGYVTSAFIVDASFGKDEEDSQTAGIVHELMESLEETEHICLGVNNEVIPQIAEFLFTGESRLNSFRTLHDDYYAGKRDEPHRDSWGDVVAAILRDKSEGNPDEIFKLLLEARKLPEEVKIQLVKDAIAKAMN